MKKLTLAVLMACATASSVAFAGGPVGEFTPDPVSIETAIAKGDLCVLPGKGASSEGAVDIYQGKTVRCVRTQTLASNGNLQAGRVEWVAVGDIVR